MEKVLLVAVICSTAVVITWLTTRVVAEYYRSKAAKSRQMSAVRRQTPSKPAQNREPGEWVTQLIEQLGHDPDELYDEEMPDELADLLQSPLAKSFLANIGKRENQETEGAPGDQAGGWF